MQPLLQSGSEMYEESSKVFQTALTDLQTSIANQDLEDLTILELIRIGEESGNKNLLEIVAGRLENLPESVQNLIENGYVLKWNQVKAYLREDIEQEEKRLEESARQAKEERKRVAELVKVEQRLARRLRLRTPEQIETARKKEEKRAEQAELGNTTSEMIKRAEIGRKQAREEKEEAKRIEAEEKRQDWQQELELAREEKRRKALEDVSKEFEVNADLIKQMIDENKLSTQDLLDNELIDGRIYQVLKRNHLETHDIRIYSELTYEYLTNYKVYGLGELRVAKIELILKELGLELTELPENIDSIDSIITRATLSPRPEFLSVALAMKIFNTSGFRTRTDIYNNLDQVIESINSSYVQKEIDPTDFENIMEYLEMYREA